VPCAHFHVVPPPLEERFLSAALRSEQPQANPPRNFVPHFAELPELGISIAYGLRRIIEAPMDQSGASKGGAPLPYPVAQSYDVIKSQIEKLIHILRGLLANINFDLIHDLDRPWINAFRICAGAVNNVLITGKLPQDSLRHLAPRGIPRTQEKDALLTWHESSTGLNEKPPHRLLH
jgi:hypothetical protein